MKKLLLGLVTVAAMPAFADTKTTTTSSGQSRLEALFEADLQYRSESESDAVVDAEGREGAYIGSGDGTVVGDRLRGTARWSLWSGNCLYPLVRSGQSVPEGLHLCTMNPAGSSKPKTELESDSMAEVMAFTALKSIKRTSRWSLAPRTPVTSG
jgi:hypothetical protein